ncbi:hypothetical protein Tco_1548560 [Tanacetum coccineum]
MTSTSEAPANESMPAIKKTSADRTHVLTGTPVLKTGNYKSYQLSTSFYLLMVTYTLTTEQLALSAGLNELNQYSLVANVLKKTKPLDQEQPKFKKPPPGSIQLPVKIVCHALEKRALYKYAVAERPTSMPREEPTC